MLAKNLRAPRGVRLPESSLTSIASRLAPTGLFQVALRKGETIGGRYRRNGYVLRQDFQGHCMSLTQLIFFNPLERL